MPANGRFELPQFTPLNFSLTDGTDIPPPPDSPIRQELAPVLTIRNVTAEPITPASSTAPKTANSTGDGHANGSLNVTRSSEGVYDGRGRVDGTSQTDLSTDSRPPMSPVSVNRPSSIRRFLSRKSLNTNYENGTNSNSSHEDVTIIERPESSMSFATGRPGKKSRQSWFKRFSSKNKNKGGSKLGANQASVIYEDMKPHVAAPAPVMPRAKGPPAPKLPEFNRMKARMEDDQGSLGSLGGGEMFKNIK